MFDYFSAEKKKRKSKEYDFHPHYSQSIIEKQNKWFEGAAVWGCIEGVVAWGCIGSLMIFSTFVPMLVYLGVWLIADLVEEHQTIERLEKHGMTQTAPLIEVRLEGKASYEAQYEFNGRTREQEITKDQYDGLLGQNTVEILVDGNTTRIKGTKPDYWVIPIAVFMIPGGVYLSWGGFCFDWAVLRSIYKKFRGHEKRKHDKPKRKRGLPEM